MRPASTANRLVRSVELYRSKIQEETVYSITYDMYCSLYLVCITADGLKIPDPKRSQSVRPASTVARSIYTVVCSIGLVRSRIQEETVSEHERGGGACAMEDRARDGSNRLPMDAQDPCDLLRAHTAAVPSGDITVEQRLRHGHKANRCGGGGGFFGRWSVERHGS